MVARAEQDVGGLDVAVDEAARVRGVERAADLGDDARRALAGRGGRSRGRACAGPALDVAHRDVQRPVAARPRSRSGSRAGGRSPRRRATRARSARGTPRPARACGAISFSATGAVEVELRSRGRRRPCRRGPATPRCGGRRRRRLAGVRHVPSDYPARRLASRADGRVGAAGAVLGPPILPAPCARPAPSARPRGASSSSASRCRSPAAACGSRPRW